MTEGSATDRLEPERSATDRSEPEGSATDRLEPERSPTGDPAGGGEIQPATDPDLLEDARAALRDVGELAVEERPAVFAAVNDAIAAELAAMEEA